MTFWDSEAQALAFTHDLRLRRDELGIEAVEYVDPNALGLLRARRGELGAVSGIPECLPPAADCAIYLDVGCAESAMLGALDGLVEAVRAGGGDPELCWSAAENDERERLRVFRHALPETVNARIAEVRKTYPDITKLGTDMAVPAESLADIVALYRSQLDARGLDYVIFGHIGDSHLHVNILPRTPEDYRVGWDLYHLFAREVVRLGGSPAAEHGIGKLKTDFLRILYGEQGVAEMLALKKLLDPDMRLGRGTLFN